MKPSERIKMNQQQHSIESTRPSQLAPQDREKQEHQEQTQEEMLAAYIEQQQRMCCPGCGEGAQIY